MLIQRSSELQLATAPPLLERGCVNAIGLEEIKEKAGLRWEKLKESIWGRLEALLRQKLSPADFSCRLDDVSYLVSMPTANAESAQLVCVMIAHEIRNALLGACEIDQIRVSRCLPAKGEEMELAPLPAEMLAALAQKAGLAHGAGARPSPEQDDRVKPLPASDLAVAPPLHKFEPVWDAQKEVITTYRCVSTEQYHNDGVVNPAVQFRAELSLMLDRLRFGIRSLAAHLAAGQRFMLLIPVSYELVGSTAARAEIVTICRGMPGNLRPYLQFEISELPFGVPQSRLSDLVGHLRAYCRSVSAQFPAQIPNYGVYQGAGLREITLALGTNEGGAIPSDALDVQLRNMCAGARRLGVATTLLRVHSLDILLRARDIGLNHIAGPIVGPAQAGPTPMKRLAVGEITRGAMMH